MKPTKYIPTAAVAFAAALLMTASIVRAEEKEDENDAIPLSQVPPAALTALQAQSTTPITKVELDDENGVISYEAEFVVNGKKQEVKVNAKGEIVPEDADDDEEDGKESESAKAGKHRRAQAETRTVKTEKHAKAQKETKSAKAEKQNKAKDAKSAKQAKAPQTNPA